MRILEINAKASCIFLLIEGQGVFDMHDLLASSEVQIVFQFSPCSRVETCNFAPAVMSHMLPWNPEAPVGVFTVWKSFSIVKLSAYLNCSDDFSRKKRNIKANVYNYMYWVNNSALRSDDVSSRGYEPLIIK